MKLPLYKVNTFTERFDRGNPAGVCPLKEWIDPALMQAIAKENEYSETAFFVKNGESYDLRWFTPVCEVDICGHATLASAAVLAKELNVEGPLFRFNTLSGELTVEQKERQFTLDMPVQTLEPGAAPETLVNGLGVKPTEIFVADDYLLVYEHEDQIRNMTPNFHQIQDINLRGTIVTAPGNTSDVDFVSRWFGSAAAGIDEDPVTGSAHRTLIPYWAQRLGKSKLTAKQLSQRGGDLICELKGSRVQVTGEVAIYLKGEINL